MQEKVELLSQLLREYEAEIGTKDLDIVVLQALISAIKTYKGKDLDDFREQFKKYLKIISKTEPKFGIIDYQFSNLRNFAKTLKNQKLWKNRFINYIKKLIKESKDQQKLILKYAEAIDVEGKTILIHDNSHTVQDVLVYLKNKGKHFNVVIAEQDFEKTHDNIERLHKARIPFQVIPAYMLSHIHDVIDMVFFGALTLKDTMVFVMQPGTHSVLSEFHTADVPSYVFMNTLKFSLWKSKKRKEIFMHRHTRKHHRKQIQYKRIKYSHDRVPTDLFHQIITNEGILSPSKIKGLFSEKIKHYSELTHKKL